MWNGCFNVVQAEVLNNAVCQPDARCLTTMETGGWGQTLTNLQLETRSEDDFGFSIKQALQCTYREFHNIRPLTIMCIWNNTLDKAAIKTVKSFA